MHFRRCAAFLVIGLVPCVAMAETCKYLDSEGRVIYSNTPASPPKGATKVKCFADPAPTGTANAGQQDSRAANAESRARAPKVSEDTQKARDDDRRRILEQELADEAKRLAQAKEQLAAQEAVRNGNERNYERFLERVQPYRDTVTSHERNIEAITREIANLR